VFSAHHTYAGFSFHEQAFRLHVGLHIIFVSRRYHSVSVFTLGIRYSSGIIFSFPMKNPYLPASASALPEPRYTHTYLQYKPTKRLPFMHPFPSPSFFHKYSTNTPTYLPSRPLFSQGSTSITTAFQPCSQAAAALSRFFGSIGDGFWADEGDERVRSHSASHISSPLHYMSIDQPFRKQRPA
jgi:hypothetical protein